MKKYDIILITPDAYVDHPAFAHALLKRNLEKNGFSVAVVDAPKWQEKDYFKYGKPKLFYAVSGGNVDSIVLNYTSFRKKRRSDDYQIDGNAYFNGMPKNEKSRIRPDRCVTVYVNGIKSFDKETPIVIGGIEASLRRFAHYDFLSDKVRASVLIDCGADILVYGMGEKAIVEIAKKVKNGEDIKYFKIPGTCRLVRKNENFNVIEIPSFDKVRNDKNAFVKMTEDIYKNTSPFNEKPLIQKHATRAVVQFQPPEPLSDDEMDEIYNHDFNYDISTAKRIPAFRMIKDSITIHRGCFGNCSFCSLTLHQGKYIQSRSETSIIKEIHKLAEKSNFTGVIRDLGGPSADMYQLQCNNVNCDRMSCLFPDICPVLKSKGIPAKNLYKKVLSLKNKNGKRLIKHLFIGSGIRYDLTFNDNGYFEFLVKNCVSGYLKVAPEHASGDVLKLMNKPSIKKFEGFLNKFKKLTAKIKKKQYIIPYLLIGHPGEKMSDINYLKDSFKKNKLKVEQVQVFTPTPMTLSTCMYYAGIVPFSREKVSVCRDVKELKKRKSIILNAFKL